MDSLPAAAAAAVAGHLLDERDLAALAATSRFWRGVLADPTLWRCLLRRRFGAVAEAAASAGTEPQTAATGAAAGAADGTVSPQQRFRELACLRRPAPQLDRIAWLDGSHLQVVTEPGSASGRAVRVHSVSWLELAARLPGVLPGWYRAAWRLRLQGNFAFTGGRIITRWLPAASEAGAAALAASSAEDRLLPMLREDGLRGALWQNAQHEPPGARTTLTLLSRAHMDAAFHQAGSGWFELHGGPFELAQPSIVYLKFHSPQGSTAGVVFDCARLERL
ncbi:hypothetical protein ABPG75_000298 [Micractinium tetrahymenae]